MAEEKEMYLEENPEDKGNGSYESPLLTLLGLMEGWSLLVRAEIEGDALAVFFASFVHLQERSFRYPECITDMY